jgi:hypothetical protein
MKRYNGAPGGLPGYPLPREKMPRRHRAADGLKTIQATVSMRIEDLTPPWASTSVSTPKTSYSYNNPTWLAGQRQRAEEDHVAQAAEEVGVERWIDPDSPDWRDHAPEVTGVVHFYIKLHLNGDIDMGWALDAAMLGRGLTSFGKPHRHRHPYGKFPLDRFGPTSGVSGEQIGGRWRIRGGRRPDPRRVLEKLKEWGAPTKLLTWFRNTHQEIAPGRLEARPDRLRLCAWHRHWNLTTVGAFTSHSWPAKYDGPRLGRFVDVAGTYTLTVCDRHPGQLAVDCVVCSGNDDPYGVAEANQRRASAPPVVDVYAEHRRKLVELKVEDAVAEPPPPPPQVQILDLETLGDLVCAAVTNTELREAAGE